jgi:putative ABC transport system permease protein
MQGDVSGSGLGASLVLVALAIGLSLWQGLGVHRELGWATVRATIQLLAVGVVLVFVIDPARSLFWSWSWVALMIVFAGVVARRRAPEVPSVLPLALVAFTAATAVTLGVVFALGIFPLEARVLVPLAGMIVGNSMNATVLVARRLIDEIRDKRAEVEARLSLGHASSYASKPYVRKSLRMALIPQIETTKAVGLVFLPGAMTGLILAGVDPFDAVLVQAAIMFIILASVSITTTVVALGLATRLFTADHRLKPLPRPADG